MARSAERLARVERLLQAARWLARPERPEARALRDRLRETTALSSENIELGLARSLELEPTAEQLESLLRSTPEAPRAHVLLSANVFVAALRAIAIGAASAPVVHVRASRRDPALAEALHALVPDVFELESSLSPRSGEHLWAYGSDATLADLRASLSRGVWLHAHGAGFGAVALEARAFTQRDARAVALDTALFDRRGCLSPQLVCVRGSAQQARDVAAALARELAALELEVPPGALSAAELAEARRQRDAAAYAFELFDAGSGWVTYSSQPTLAASGRNLHVVPTTDPSASLAPFAPHLTCIASNTPDLQSHLQLTFPGARHTLPGNMQRPPLDGPVDRRKNLLGELL